MWLLSPSWIHTLQYGNSTRYPYIPYTSCTRYVRMCGYLVQYCNWSWYNLNYSYNYVMQSFSIFSFPFSPIDLPHIIIIFMDRTILIIINPYRFCHASLRDGKVKYSSYNLLSSQKCARSGFGCLNCNYVLYLLLLLYS